MIQNGESQSLDLKEMLPPDEKLGKTIAAFATCGGGKIVVGVNRNKEIVGLTIVEDSFRAQIDNTAMKVQPQCSYEVDFLNITEKIVSVITVYKGDHPVYYFKNKPCVRVGTVSRPATPEEVESLVLDYYFKQGLRAVKNELKIIERMIMHQTNILAIPTNAWDNLLKSAATNEHDNMITKLTDIYTKILIWNSIGFRLGIQTPIESYGIYLDKTIGQFCVERKKAISENVFNNALQEIDEFLKSH
jgi:hypothetical protein